MNIFNKRPLSLVLCILLGGFVLFSTYSIYFLIASVLCAAGFIVYAFLIDKTLYLRVLSLICVSALCLGVLLSYLYFDLWFKAYDRFDGEVYIKGEIIDIHRGDFSNRYTVKTANIEDKLCSHYKLHFYLQKDEPHVKNLTEGAEISFRATLLPISSGDDFDAGSYYAARGVSAVADGIGDIEIRSIGDEPLARKFERMREFLTRHAVMLTDEDTGSFISALLFGERDSLSGQVILDFTRVGIMHILALSGMHLAILSLGIERLLSLIRIGKRYRTALIMLFVGIYVAFTGFSVSVVRAGVMLLITKLLSLLRLTRDSVTSLAIAVFAITVATPYAIFDTALWLSVFATLGVVVFYEYSARRHGSREYENTSFKFYVKRGLLWVISSLLASLFAIGATFLITVKSFSGISLIAPISTTIFSIIIEIIMYLGTVLFLLGWIFPIGFILTPLCSHATSLAGVFSSADWIYVSDSYLAIEILTAVFVFLFYLFLIVKIEKRLHKNIAVSILSVMLVSIFVLSGILHSVDSRTDRISYRSGERCDEFLIRRDGEVALISSAQNSKNVAYDTLDYLNELRITSVDMYYFTHYSYGIEDTLEVLLPRVLIDEIYLPFPQNEDELSLIKRYEEICREYRTEIELVARGGIIPISDIGVMHAYSVPYGEGTSTNAFAIIDGDMRYTYLSSGMLTVEPELSREYISVSDALIFGRHGKRYTDSLTISENYPRIKTLIFSSENLYLSQESYVLYDKNGCKIYSHPSKIDIYLEAD